MAKEKKSYICLACNARFGKWAGQCAECGEWNTVEEQEVRPAGPGSNFQGYSGSLSVVHTMAEVSLEKAPRFSTGAGAYCPA